MNPLRWTKTDLLILALLVPSSLAAAWRLWQPGLANPADMLLGVYRVHELNDAIRAGLLYPRIGPNLNFGYGAPLLQYYPPLAGYTAWFFYQLGLDIFQATKAVFSLALLLASSGMYLFARQLLADRRAAFVSAAAYLFAPYLLLVVYERGAAAEALALGLLPWVFYAMHLALTQHRREAVIGAGITSALLPLAHNITALFALPAVVLYALVLLFAKRNLRHWWRVALIVALGLSISAFYWMPALFELPYSRTATQMLGGAADSIANLNTWRAVVQRSWVFDYWDTTRFQFALWHAIFSLLALVLLIAQPRPRRDLLACFGVLWLLALLLQLEVAAPFWRTVPLVRFIQFPWRLLGLASLCSAVLIGSLVGWRQWRRWGNPVAVGLTLVLTAVVVIQGIYLLRPSLSDRWYQFSVGDIGHADLFARGRQDFPLFSDYTPRALSVAVSTLAESGAWPIAEQLSLDTAPAIQVRHETYASMRLQVQAAAPFALRAHRIWFPGWQFFVDGQRVETVPVGPAGLASAEIPPGDHRVDFRFVQTPLRRAADSLSIVTLAACVVVWLGVRRKRATSLVGVALGAALLVSVGYGPLHQQIQARQARHPITTHANFQNELHLLGYHIPTTPWQPGTTIPIHLYWFVQQPPQHDYKVFFHLAQLDDSGTVAQADNLPNLGYSPMTKWLPGEVIADPYPLDLSADIPPGRYRLLVGLYEPSTVTNLRVLDADHVLPGDRVVLAEIEVEAP